MSPIEQVIREMIGIEGPMRLDRYMSLCLGHPVHGYYMSRDPLGEKGDFITAPEISQTFGELIAIWCVGAWAAMGSPAAFNLVELGPGRGTLMADILRTVRKAAPAFASAALVQLVETSPVLRQRQRDALEGQARWHDSLDDVPDGPMILVANEFFDALPIRQFEKWQGRWHERVMGLEDGGLTIGLAPIDLAPLGTDGDVIESAPVRNRIAEDIGFRLARNPGAALIVDYGHLVSAPGDTLQAMRGHRYVSLTESPGDCDLTSHVDFEALAKGFRAGGATAWPAITQRAFLLAMGLEQRIARLASRSEPATRAVLERQMRRLAAEDQMGNLFKVMAATSPGLATTYPFGST
ncbi:class I SAM-dependent methyltransferase [Aestuariivirga sp.]|uniref:class I SAM-dependent methyltransferase n=1 Tax=Aestuariivirga sp. TaxID=2650926 RepID=UPI0035932F76